MRAVRIVRPGGPEVLRVEEVPEPRPGPGEALVRIRAAGVNRADILQRRGRYPAPAGWPSDVPGLEFAGEVLEVSLRTGAPKDDAEAAAAAGGGSAPVPGDRVMGLLGGGGYAERAALPTAHLLPVPAGLSWAEAAAIPEAFLTAADALFTRGRLEPGEDVMIHAAGGGVGTAALQLAREGGARMILGTASAPKLEAIGREGLPLDRGVDYRHTSFREAVAEVTGGRGVDVILDTVGAAYWSDNLASLAELGRLVLVGLLGGASVEADLGRLMRGRVTVVGTVLRSRSAAEKARLTAAFRERFLPRFAEGDLRPVLDRAWPLEDAAEAHRWVEANRSFGRVVLEVGEG